MAALRERRLDEAAVAAIAAERPFLGVCIGMQMLFDGSDESPGVDGLGVFPGRVRRLPDGVKHPQMQWNVIDVKRPCVLLDGLPEPTWAYFVHSYAADADPADVVATCDYGGPVTAMVGRDRLWATQFHPEKSSDAGLALLANFVAAVRRDRLMQLYPAIDLRAGRCVRLYQGDFAQETVYGDDPVAQAASVRRAPGVAWVHVVDLDAARTGEPVNRPVIAAHRRGQRRARIQTGGGVRDDAAADALLGAGRRPRRGRDRGARAAGRGLGELAARYPGQVALGLDVRGDEVAIRGWVEGAGRSLLDVAGELADAGFAALDRHPDRS